MYVHVPEYVLALLELKPGFAQTFYNETLEAIAYTTSPRRQPKESQCLNSFRLTYNTFRGVAGNISYTNPGQLTKNAQHSYHTWEFSIIGVFLGGTHQHSVPWTKTINLYGYPTDLPKIRTDEVVSLVFPQVSTSAALSNKHKCQQLTPYTSFLVVSMGYW